MSNDLLVSLGAILPLVILAVWAFILLLLDVFLFKDKIEWTAGLSAIGILVSLGFVLARLGHVDVAFGGMIIVDEFSHFISVILLISGLAGIAISHDYLRRTDIHRGEYYIMLLFAIIGMMLMGMSSDLIMIFLSLELLSIPLYILAGIAVPRIDSEEASIKYFLLGAFASSIFVYGTALIFGSTTVTNLSEITKVIHQGTYDPTLFLVGSALILIGLSFKVAVVPFHMWTPDVYQGAPSSVTAFMAVGAKVAGFAAMMRIFFMIFPNIGIEITPILWTLSVITMFLGNLVAIAQKNIKRMLAYSSIAHAGYILMALVTYTQADISQSAIAATIFYLVAYAFTNFAAWSVVIALEQKEEKGLDLDNYAGLGRRYPALAAVMAVAMLSFTGVPPTLGFIGKFMLFQTVLQGGFIWLAIIGVVTSLISAFYYLRVIVIMYMQEGEPIVAKDNWLYITAYATGIGIVFFSIFSTPILHWAYQAVLSVF